jgi:hypothetical protein
MSVFSAGLCTYDSWKHISWTHSRYNVWRRTGLLFWKDRNTVAMHLIICDCVNLHYFLTLCPIWIFTIFSWSNEYCIHPNNMSTIFLKCSCEKLGAPLIWGFYLGITKWEYTRCSSRLGNIVYVGFISC